MFCTSRLGGRCTASLSTAPGLGPSVLERTREFGIVMALGLKPGRLGRLVMLETALMGFLGLVLGAIAGGLVTAWFTSNGLALPGMEEMAAQFNLPARVYPSVNVLSLLVKNQINHPANL